MNTTACCVSDCTSLSVIARTFTLKHTSLIEYGYLRFFSKPVDERKIYRAIARQQARRFVEIGIGQADRTKRMLAVAGRFHDRKQLAYTGIDLFEDRPASAPGLSLKYTHQLLRPLVGKFQLAPGDPHSVLKRHANTLVQSDIIVVTGNPDDKTLLAAWFYVPRMLHSNTCVFVVKNSGEDTENHIQLVSRQEITRLAFLSPPSARRAA